MIYMKSYKAFEAVYTNSNGGNFWGDIGAGILPICTTTKRILINHRSEDVNEPNTWGVWGGALDSGYSPEEGALKEFKEECGYDGDIKLIPAYIFQTKTKNFTYYNFLGLVETEFIPVLDWESQGYKWVNFNELSEFNLHFGLTKLIENSIGLINKIL